MSLKKYTRGLCLLMLCGIAALGGAGCKKNDANKAQVKEEIQLKTIGVKSDDGFNVELKNSTGKDISGLAIKKTDEEKFESGLLASSDMYKNGESRILYYTDPSGSKTGKSDMEKSGESTDKTDTAVNNTSAEKLLIAGYDVELTFADGAKTVLHGFPFEDVKKAELMMENGVGYLKYTSVASGQTLETKEAELAVAESEKAAKKAEAEAAKKAAEEAAKKAAEEEAAKKAAEEAASSAAESAQPTYTEPVYTEPAQPVYEEPAYTEPAQPAAEEPAGNDDACLTDGLTY